MEDNPLPIVVANGSHAVTLGSSESNYHLIAAAYEDNSLYLDISHFLTDGQGSFPFLQTMLYCYLHSVHPEEAFDTKRIIMPDSEIKAAEMEDDPYPDAPISVEPLGSSERPEEIFSMPDQIQGYEGMDKWTNIQLMIRQKDIMGYISSLDGSPSSFFSSLTYRAVDDLHPDNHLPVVCGMQHSFRKALGKPFSHLCHVNIVPIIYPNRLRGRDLERLNTITRGSVILRSDDDNDLQTINRHIRDRESLKEMSLSRKRDFMKKEVLEQIGQNTFEISYTGRVPWCGLDKYIVSVSPYLDMTLSGGISIEIFSTGDCFTVNYMQRSTDTRKSIFKKEKV